MPPVTVWLALLITSSRASIPPALMAPVVVAAHGSAGGQPPPHGSAPGAETPHQPQQNRPPPSIFGKPASDGDSAAQAPLDSAAARAVAAGPPVTQGQWLQAGPPGQWQQRQVGVPVQTFELPSEQEVLRIAEKVRAEEELRNSMAGSPHDAPESGEGGPWGRCGPYPPVPPFVSGAPLVPPPSAPPSEFGHALQPTSRAASEAFSGVPLGWSLAEVPQDRQGPPLAAAQLRCPPAQPPRLAPTDIFGQTVKQIDSLAGVAVEAAQRAAAADVD
jgi:hypothetical protein